MADATTTATMAGKTTDTPANITSEYQLNNPAMSLQDILAALTSSAGTVANAYNQPAYTAVTDPSVRNAQSLADALGVNFTYDRGEIEKIYQDATKAAFNAEQLSGTENKYYQHLADAQNTALDTIRQQYGQAVATGANKGMQAANILSGILGVTQTANDEATQLAVDRQQLVNQYAQQLKQDSVDALKYSNEQASQIGTLSHQLYNDDIQALTAQLAYNQAINTDAAGYAANKYTADANLKGSIANAGAGVYNNNQSSVAALQSAIEQARATKYAADKGQYQKLEYAGGYTVSS